MAVKVSSFLVLVKKRAVLFKGDRICVPPLKMSVFLDMYHMFILYVLSQQKEVEPPTNVLLVVS
jgi:hypothetical protein